MTIPIPLVAILGVVILVVAWRYLGFKAGRVLVCLLAVTSAAPLAVHQSRHDIADATPRSGGHVPASKPAGPGLPNTQHEESR